MTNILNHSRAEDVKFKRQIKAPGFDRFYSQSATLTNPEQSEDRIDLNLTHSKIHQPGLLGTPLGRGADHGKPFEITSVSDADGNANVKVSVQRKDEQTFLRFDDGTNFAEKSFVGVSDEFVQQVDSLNEGSHNSMTVIRSGDEGWIIAGETRFGTGPTPANLIVS